MRLTIIREDNAVIVDGERHTVDCSTLSSPFHALQWNGQDGEIEYSTTRCDHCGARSKKANEFIRDVTPYQTYVDAWGVAKAAAAEEAAQAEAAKVAAMEAAKAAEVPEAANAAGPQG